MAINSAQVSDWGLDLERQVDGQQDGVLGLWKNVRIFKCCCAALQLFVFSFCQTGLLAGKIPNCSVLFGFVTVFFIVGATQQWSCDHVVLLCE